MDKPIYQYLKLGPRKMIAERYKQEIIWEAVLEEYRNEEERVSKD